MWYVGRPWPCQEQRTRIRAQGTDGYMSQFSLSKKGSKLAHLCRAALESNATAQSREDEMLQRTGRILRFFFLWDLSPLPSSQTKRCKRTGIIYIYQRGPLIGALHRDSGQQRDHLRFYSKYFHTWNMALERTQNTCSNRQVLY